MDEQEVFVVQRTEPAGYQFYVYDELYEKDFMDIHTMQQILDGNYTLYKLSNYRFSLVKHAEGRTVVYRKREECFYPPESTDIHPIPLDCAIDEPDYDDDADFLVDSPAITPLTVEPVSPPMPYHYPLPIYQSPYMPSFTPLLNSLTSTHTNSLALRLIELGSSHERIQVPKQVQTISLKPPQKRISSLVIQDALNKNQTCPITLSYLDEESAVCVAPCYHVFDKSAITTWLKQNTTCPECREPCCL
jgi:hypothetical protein